MTFRRDLEARIAMGRGERPADLVLKGGRVFDLITGDFLEGDVAFTKSMSGVQFWYPDLSTRICISRAL